MLKKCSAILLLLICSNYALAQSDLKFENLPGYGAYKSALETRGKAGRSGRAQNLVWTQDGKFLNFKYADKDFSLDLATFKFGDAKPVDDTKPTVNDPPRRNRSGVGRAEQRVIEPSPDGKWNAVYRDNNVFIEPVAEGEGEKTQVTTTGMERLRYGTGCWVYGEELNQQEAMWWSPDGKMLVFYEVDEQGLKDYFLTIDNVQTYTQLHTTRYPKAGEDNPQVNLMVYDLNTKQTKRLKIDGEPRQYLFNIKFTPDGKELLVNRTNRHQDVLDVLAIDLGSGTVRTVVTEKQSTWQENSPEMRFLEDGRRFIWETEANGWKNYQLRSLDGKLICPLTNAVGFPCEKLVKVDEKNNWLYFTAYSDKNPYSEQLHRVKLDGTDETRITTSPLHHSSFDIDPNGKFVASVREQIDIAPANVVYSTEGKEVACLRPDETAEGNGSKAAATAEMFSFLAPDEKTVLFGTLHKPLNFDPAKKYPLLIDVYGGPNSRGLSNAYSPINPICEMGFLVAKIGNRGTVGRGKAFESATYLKLGSCDLDDQAAGVKFLSKRPYVDGNRVGIYGHSYGGYMSALALLRYPDVFQVGVAGAPVTDWINYDTIYTERYMRTPQENNEGYKQGSCMEYVDALRGKLLIVHGLIDDNVHPANTWQLIKALQDKDKRFDLMIYPEFKHGIRSTYDAVKWEYLYRHLIAELPASSRVTSEKTGTN